MTNPVAIIEWQTADGLGTYNATTTLSLQFNSTSFDSEGSPYLASIIQYKLLSGSLPVGTKADPIQITSDGLLTGTLANITEETNYTFTVRAQDQFKNLRDKTFNITILVGSIPLITTLPGSILDVRDSLYVSYQFTYTNPITSNIVHFSIANGELPPGLQLTNDGKIIGYPNKPLLADDSPTIITYDFTIQLSSELGNDAKQYSITIANQNLYKPPNTRVPVLLNTKPLSYPIQPNDPYYDYYVDSSKILPTTRANEFYTFKFLGFDFDGNSIVYTFGSLPPGLIGDIYTGWITGTPIMNTMGINTYEIEVSVGKLDNPSIESSTEVYSLTITNELEEDITWITPVDMGVIYNGTISDLQIEATSSKHLVYSFKTGKLPPNLELTESGNLVGRVAFQPSTTVLQENDETDFYFTILVYSDQFPVLKSTREFKLTVKQYFKDPLETVYFKATPNLQSRQVINSLLTDEALIPTDYLYRSDDLFFGKASEIKVLHATGMTPTNLTEYLAAIQENHYYRSVILGELQTAVARDDNNNIIYEVVYSEVIDNLVNSKGKTPPLRFLWPEAINNGVKPYVYPGSIPDMRTELVNNIEQTTDNLLLPKWMTSQQRNGNTLGFIEAWVICYTLPNYSETVKSNINSNWPHTFNEIDFEIDRYIVDKSATYNWNRLLQIPVWNELPSASPQPDPIDEHDMVVIFPRKTILVANPN